MKILVDADSCNRISNIEKIAKANSIDVILYCDYSRTLSTSYSTLVLCDISSDSVDFTIINNCSKGDIVVTNDVGLASMAMAKGARVIKNTGQIYTYRTVGYDLSKRAEFMRIRRREKHINKVNKASFALHNNKRYNFNSSLIRLIKNNITQTKMEETAS